MRRLTTLAIAILMLATGIVIGFSVRSFPTVVEAQSGCQTFPQTGHTVCGKFLTYWQTHGGLAQQGYPISEPFQEKSDLDGKTYTVQYFERAVFEMHPENQPPYDVLLSQLGTFRFKEKYPNGAPAGQPTPQAPQPTTPPAVQGPKLDILDYRFVPADSSGEAYVYGVAKNTGTVQLGTPTIAATLKDASGKLVGTDSSDGPLGMMPGDIWPFELGFQSAPAGASNVQFTVQADEAGSFEKSQAYRDFQVSDVNVIPPAQYSQAKVVGNVKNIGTGKTTLVQVYVLITDENNKVLETASTFADLTTIAPGQSSPFSVSIDSDKTPHVTVVAYGFRQ